MYSARRRSGRSSYHVVPSTGPYGEISCLCTRRAIDRPWLAPSRSRVSHTSNSRARIRRSRVHLSDRILYGITHQTRSSVRERVAHPAPSVANGREVTRLFNFTVLFMWLCRAPAAQRVTQRAACPAPAVVAAVPEVQCGGRERSLSCSMRRFPQQHVCTGRHTPHALG